MRCIADPDPGTFIAAAWQFLDADPVAHNVICSAALACAAGEFGVTDALWLRVVEGAGPYGELVGAAIQTPPRGLVLSLMPDGAARVLARDLATRRPELPLVSGPDRPATAFAETFTALTGLPATPVMSLVAMSADHVDRPAGVPGRGRTATTADRLVLIDWYDAFRAEATPNEPLDDASGLIDARLAMGRRMWIWEDGGRPVSTTWQTALEPASGTLPGIRVVRVSMVYTPPELRGHGYASALVAMVTRAALDGGAAACMLFTDASNPISNKIYQRIGYRPVSTAVNWLFSNQAGAVPGQAGAVPGQAGAGSADRQPAVGEAG